jgi:hypothetical protein
VAVVAVGVFESSVEVMCWQIVVWRWCSAVILN